MKRQPSAGAAADADLSYVQRAFLPGLTGSSTDRWLEATPRLFLSLNGEENGREAPLRGSGFSALVRLALAVVVTAPLTGGSSVHAAFCQGPDRHHGGFLLLSGTLAELPSGFNPALMSGALRRVTQFLKRRSDAALAAS